jgi:hypothetical protein
MKPGSALIFLVTMKFRQTQFYGLSLCVFLNHGMQVYEMIVANISLNTIYSGSFNNKTTADSGFKNICDRTDDSVLGFEHEQDARRFLQDMQERLQAFGLRLHPDKTRLIRFGRQAISDRNRLGERKPETFDFLGFTHFCTQSRKNGAFVIGRKTIKKRMRARLLAVKNELRKRWHDPLPTTGQWIHKVLVGYMNYFSVSGQYLAVLP